MINDNNEKDIPIKSFLCDLGLSVPDALRIALEAVALHGKEVDSILKGMRKGAEELQKFEKTVTFNEALEETLKAKSHRRPRTLSDIRQLGRRMIESNRGLSNRPLRAMSARECERIIEKAFDTPRQRFKAHAILSGIFTIGFRRGWCSENPVRKMDLPVIREKEIRVLSPGEVKKLLTASESCFDGSCAPAVGLMVYAGIRPEEITRLHWSDINLDDGIISLRPRHSKTGGARHVTIHPVLLSWLKRFRQHGGWAVCPPNWSNKWRHIRQCAGWAPGTWQHDYLRHTYASYHAKHFKNYNLQQTEMGQSSPHLLRTRYLNMSGVTAEGALDFWSNRKPSRIGCRLPETKRSKPKRYYSDQ